MANREFGPPAPNRGVANAHKFVAPAMPAYPANHRPAPEPGSGGRGKGRKDHWFRSRSFGHPCHISIIRDHEVKGLSGPNFSVGLTPNEYQAFRSESPDYRLAVVCNALTDPSLYICRYSGKAQAWTIENHADLHVQITPFQSAMISVNLPGDLP